MRGNRKGNGRYIFIPPETTSEAEHRRKSVVRRMNEVKAQARDLEHERRDLVDELRHLNSFIRQPLQTSVTVLLEDIEEQTEGP